MRAALPLILLLNGSAAYAVQQEVRGPAVLCGEAFALILAAGETATVNDPDMDFITHDVWASDGEFVLYEGNLPQAYDDAVRTGLGRPNLIAIHDNRNAAAKSASRIRDRLLAGRQRAAQCKQASHSA